MDTQTEPLATLKYNDCDISTDTMINIMFDLIKEGSPKIKSPLADKFVYETNPSKVDEDFTITNTLASLICSGVSDRQCALEIYNLCKKNAQVAEMFMTYFVSRTQKRRGLVGHSILEFSEILLKSVCPQMFQYTSIVDIELRRRNEFIEVMGYSVPSKDAVAKLKDFCGEDSVLEIGSGLGLWAYLMKLSGIKIIATDIGEKGEYGIDFSKSWTPIQIIGHLEALKTFESNVLFLSWPTDQNEMSQECLDAFTGNKLVYVGECFGGSTATDVFFKKLHEKFTLKEMVDIPQWAWIYDKIYLYERI
jgi:hypothetical protein